MLDPRQRQPQPLAFRGIAERLIEDLLGQRRVAHLLHLTGKVHGRPPGPGVDQLLGRREDGRLPLPAVASLMQRVAETSVDRRHKTSIERLHEELAEEVSGLDPVAGVEEGPRPLVTGGVLQSGHGLEALECRGEVVVEFRVAEGPADRHQQSPGQFRRLCRDR